MIFVIVLWGEDSEPVPRIRNSLWNCIHEPRTTAVPSLSHILNPPRVMSPRYLLVTTNDRNVFIGLCMTLDGVWEAQMRHYVPPLDNSSCCFIVRESSEISAITFFHRYHTEICKNHCIHVPLYCPGAKFTSR